MFENVETVSKSNGSSTTATRQQWFDSHFTAEESNVKTNLTFKKGSTFTCPACKRQGRHAVLIQLKAEGDNQIGAADIKQLNSLRPDLNLDPKGFYALVGAGCLDRYAFGKA